MERYGAALARGDLETAVSLRCENARVDGEELDRFENDLDVLAESMGTIETIRAISEQPVEEASESYENPTEVRYAVVAGGEEIGELLQLTVIENDEWRLCGTATTEQAALRSSVPEALRPADTDVLEPKGFMLSPPAAETVTEDGPLPAESGGSGEVSSWTRAWSTDGYGGVRLTAVRFERQEQAVDATTTQLEDRASGAFAPILVPGVEGATGQRVTAFAKLGVQPTEVGPYVDMVYAVYGEVLVSVSVGGLPTGSDHDAVRSLMREVHTLVASS